MSNQKQIKKRVASIKNIKKITSALEMVAASKVQKAQDKAQNAKPYADKVYELIEAFSEEKDISDLPLLRKPREVKKDMYILISTNKGLAGSLNTSLFLNLKTKLKEKNCPHVFVTFGVKGRNFGVSEGELLADFSDKEPFEDNIPSLVELVKNSFISEEVDEVYVVYNDFVSIMNQEPVIKRLLPIIAEEGKEKPKAYEFEPSPREVLSSLLMFYLENQVRDAIFEAEASEHAARMVAMKNASDNAKELSESLSLEYNKARQASITNEIADVVTSAITLE